MEARAAERARERRIEEAIEAKTAADAKARADEKAAKQAAKAKKEAAKKAEDRRKGFHCLSMWDGSHRGFVNAVKERMNDPDSFEHDSTKVTPVGVVKPGRHSIVMEFRGRNAFGGMVRNTAVGSYLPNCSYTLDGIL